MQDIPVAEVHAFLRDSMDEVVLQAALISERDGRTLAEVVDVALGDAIARAAELGLIERA